MVGTPGTCKQFCRRPNLADGTAGMLRLDCVNGRRELLNKNQGQHPHISGSNNALQHQFFPNCYIIAPFSYTTKVRQAVRHDIYTYNIYIYIYGCIYTSESMYSCQRFSATGRPTCALPAAESRSFSPPDAWNFAAPSPPPPSLGSNTSGTIKMSLFSSAEPNGRADSREERTMSGPPTKTATRLSRPRSRLSAARVTVEGSSGNCGHRCRGWGAN